MNKLSIEKFVVFGFLCCLVCTLGSVSGYAQTESSNVSADTHTGAALPPEILALRREANAATYNIDYATAREKYEEIRKRLPQHPAGDLYLATVIWLEYLYKTRRLQTGLY
ncbi:MAG: hypothetical protein J2P31_20445, partial [Blastocatellia bacterium]|nr:hypothetical protein [Blastocatellia bacterium]